MSDAREPIGRAMVVAAHPDDAEFAFGATVARLTDEGTEVVYVVCTDGSQGGEDPEPAPEEIAAVRSAEQRSAAAFLGVRDVVFLGFPDGALVAGLDLRRALTREIRRWRPEVLLTHWPERSLSFPIGASHPDHFAAGEAAMAAVYPDARNPRAFRELLDDKLEPHVVDEIWLPGFANPDLYVDVTAHASRKIAAILHHRSQFATQSDPEGSLRWVLDRMRGSGEHIGCEYAEAFVRVRTGAGGGTGPLPPPAPGATLR